jgi:uncharacterized protein (TIGR01777 family)
MNVSKTSTVLVPSTAIYDWHTRPGAFERLLPPWESVTLVDSVGDFEHRFVDMNVHRLGVTLRWLAQHVDVQPSISFSDIQVKGPFKSWRHDHQFIPLSDSRTKMMDTISFELPFHAVARFVSGWGIRRTIDRMLTYRHAVIKHDLTLLHSYPVSPKVIAITGGSGLIGRHLTHFLTAAGHTVKQLVRKDKPDWAHEIVWHPEQGILGDFSDVNVIIHLAGESVAAPLRWTDKKKTRIRQSRVTSTQVLADQLNTTSSMVDTFICASAIGIYPSTNQPLTENGPLGDRFLSTVVADWEGACDSISSKIRVVNARFGTVLHPAGGVIKRLNPLMKVGMLGPIGSGEQYTSWVALDDAIRAIYVAMARPDLSGPVNIVSPHPVMQSSWIKAWASAVKRPAIAPLPESAVNVLMGEMGAELLLQSHRVVPKKLLDIEFPFQCHTMADVCSTYGL